MHLDLPTAGQQIEIARPPRDRRGGKMTSEIPETKQWNSIHFDLKSPLGLQVQDTPILYFDSVSRFPICAEVATRV